MECYPIIEAMLIDHVMESILILRMTCAKDVESDLASLGTPRQI